MTSEGLSVLMLSWEFPPRIIGGISSHVYDLSMALARRNVRIHVVTCDFPGAPENEQVGRVNVHRFNSKRQEEGAESTMIIREPSMRWNGT
jgi:glycosyltransferase involved in cell wall biosynthesis